MYVIKLEDKLAIPATTKAHGGSGGGGKKGSNNRKKWFKLINFQLL